MNWNDAAISGTLPEDFHGGVKWQSPSNIAIVKYWGKKDNQLPRNPSISFTLSQCRTETSVFFEKSDRFSLDFRFDGKENVPFSERIKEFLVANLPFFPFLSQLDLKIDSHNTFPHSSGIASSASSMSALIMCLLDIERMANDETAIDLQKASYLARLASGSASRSVFPTMALWGATNCFTDSSDDYAVPIGDILHPVFKTYRDSILVVSDGQKQTSSRMGHALMDTNPYASSRYNQAQNNIASLLSALKTGDLEAFVNITEAEALQLHALMMCSNPSYVLLKPNTLNIIAEVRRYREQRLIPVAFTLDAGPNVHLLYPESWADEVKSFIANALEPFCMNSQWIEDRVGTGPSNL